MENETNKLQEQYEKIHRFFKTTTEPYDALDWDGETLEVILKNKVIETYSTKDLSEIIPSFE